jgi:hypothetical protein
VNKEAAVEPATTDRIQRMIDAEATERFPLGAVPQLNAAIAVAILKPPAAARDCIHGRPS